MIKIEHTNSNESTKQSNKISQFVENVKIAINKTLAATGIAVSTLYPTSINTIPTACMISSPIAKTITIGTASSLLAACSENTVPEGIKDTTPPTIDILKPEIDVTGGKEMQIIGNQLYIGGTIVASRSDNISKECKVHITINGGGFQSGDIIVDEGTLTLRVTDQSGNVKTAEIKLKLTKEEQSFMSGLENLKKSSLQVDQEIDLLKGITFAYGIKLKKTEIQLDGQKTIIEDPNHYTPEYPGECSIIFTIEKKDNTTAEITVDKLTIKPLEYKTMPITNLKPADILPITGQVEWEGGYSSIEHLRVAESTKMRDMMRQYGAGNHTPEQYQQLMSRLHTGMTRENPTGYDNYEKLGGDFMNSPSIHAHNERNILNTIVNHTSYEIADDNERDITLNQLANNNPNNIYIFGNSKYAQVNTNEYMKNERKNLKEANKLPNFIIFVAGSNIRKENGILKTRIFQEDVDPDPSCVYGLPSYANGENDTNTDKHLIVTIGTNSKGNIDITNEPSGSKFPVGFHSNILFSGRSFPFIEGQFGHTIMETGNYETSYTNYFNVAMTDLCFQMFAEVENVDQLLNMIRSTSLTDYISLDGETQALQLINPAGFIQKYLMPTDLPTEIKPGENIPLNKGYYKGIIFDIPGAELNINGERISYNDANKNLIKSQNPFNLEWRLNGNLCKKLGYSPSKPIQGKVMISDDEWNSLNITLNINITINP